MNERACNINECLNNENGFCGIIVPTVLKSISPNDKSCQWFEQDLKEELKRFKSKGGMRQVYLQMAEENKPARLAASKNEIKVSWTYGDLSIIRQRDRSYKIFDKNRKQITAKPVFIEILVKNGYKEEDIRKKGTRSLGNKATKMLKNS